MVIFGGSTEVVVEEEKPTVSFVPHTGGGWLGFGPCQGLPVPEARCCASRAHRSRRLVDIALPSWPSSP